ncbi:1-deoxy-D-xylulose-5-phosphate reductoisomerase [Desulfoplanes formicivorans]|uniref:1-deoxy-D-xylulose 5-phosphate reductoisomerase n=1 Tax=Desulfoplanes formicivorans TaxID=1592317 RepID=A0A194AEE0_9BACT|nr:1-deoxy-D-xylulose-5-phosphate reductoisomerase [Desulfoplanes formicivorans]GAU07570.1 1-deoxy-D-xylulose 5-phosphate reductoisomerase [Desulfoplanes formicivorans]
MTYISSLAFPAHLVAGPRSVTILGSTGSIGTNALEVIARNPERFRITGLAGATNTSLLAKQATRFRPRRLGVLTTEKARELTALLPAGYSPEIVVGQEGYMAMAQDPDADMIVSAQVGAAGLAPTLTAAQAGKVLCLANKESLVLGGHLIRKACASTGSVILPVDSEHNAIFQALSGHDLHMVRRILLTASGGPFRTRSLSFLRTVTPEQALKHPNWSMGAKISIDSATLMNKGLEVIEAFHLFGTGPETIEVVVHPQSIVHSMVEYRDGSILAHMGVPDMKIPIGYCLTYPERIEHDLDHLDFATLGTLQFEKPRRETFRCLDLAFQALAAGPSHPVVLNAANEIAVQAFLDRQIPFLGIPALVEAALDQHTPRPLDSLEDILDLDASTRTFATHHIATSPGSPG